MQSNAYCGFNRLFLRAGQDQWSRHRARRTRGKFFDLRGSTRRRLRSRRSSASMRCSRSSANSTAHHRTNASSCATSAAGRSSLRWRPGRASSSASFLRAKRLPKRPIQPHSWTTLTRFLDELSLAVSISIDGGGALRTAMPRNARSATLFDTRRPPGRDLIAIFRARN